MQNGLKIIEINAGSTAIKVAVKVISEKCPIKPQLSKSSVPRLIHKDVTHGYQINAFFTLILDFIQEITK